jgi:2-iminobutanoate/2-iminopropanoate deaminase
MDELDREIVRGPGVPPQIGPYSQAVRAAGLVFVAGQPGIDPDSGEPAGPTFGAQARQAFHNLEAVLLAGGSRPDLVVNTTVLVASILDFQELNELFGAFFPKDPPARMVMQVPLPAGLLISIGCVALSAPDA